MEKEEMIDFLKARGLFEAKMNQLVGWQLSEMVENAEDMGVPTLEEIEEMEIVKEIKKNLTMLKYLKKLAGNYV